MDRDLPGLKEAQRLLAGVAGMFPREKELLFGSTCQS